MLNFVRSCHKRTKGQAIVFVVVLAPIVLGIAGFAVDAGQIYVNKTNVQRTADAAALAGAQTVLSNQTTGINDAKAYATNNGDPNATVTASTTIRAHDTITVTCTKTVPTTFLGMLHVTSGTVSATAKAQVGPAGSAYGILPWAINDDSFASVGYNVTFTLEPANGNGGGLFNFVSITPPGGQTYADAIVNGVTSEILLNTNYPTNAADGSGLSSTTANALQARINARPAETYATATTGSPRILFVPTINGGIPNAPTPVQFNGFRAFFIESVNQAQGTVKGRFVQVHIPAGTIGGIGVVDKGVHVIKLIS
jgi:Flp pilus assembly protein TadG